MRTIIDLLYSVSIRFSTDNRLVVHGNEIDISIRSQPERGKANAELIKRLARHFKVKAANIRIVYGLTSRKKLVEIL